MKDTVAAVIALLKADTAVKAVVSDRVYRGSNVPSTPTKPFIAVDWVDRVPEPPTSSSTYRTDRVQCTSFETSGAKAAILSDYIGDVLAQNSNLIAPVNGIEICEIDDRGAIPDNSDATTGTYRDNHDFMITYRLR